MMPMEQASECNQTVLFFETKKSHTETPTAAQLEFATPSPPSSLDERLDASTQREMASADEADEMVELMAMLGPSSAESGESPTKRQSATTASKYNRWVAGEQNREVAAVLRAEAEKLKKQQAERKEAFLQGVTARKQEKAQRDSKKKQQAERRLQDNLSTGQEVKEKAAALKAAKEKQNEEHMERGRAAADRDEEQRRKIRKVKGDAFKSVAEKTARAKQQELDTTIELAREKERVRAEKAAKADKVRQQTGREVLDAGQEFAYNQRRAMAASTVVAHGSNLCDPVALTSALIPAEGPWLASRVIMQSAAAAAAKDERKAKEEEHLQKAKVNKAAALASRAAAKQKREEIVTSRQVARQPLSIMAPEPVQTGGLSPQPVVS